MDGGVAEREVRGGERVRGVRARLPWDPAFPPGGSGDVEVALNTVASAGVTVLCRSGPSDRDTIALIVP